MYLAVFASLLAGLLGNRFRLWLLYRQEQFEFRWQLILRVQPVGEVHAAYSAVGVYLHAQRFHVVGTVGAAGKIRQIELDLIPALVQPHRHGTDEGFNARRRLIVAGTKPAANVFIIQYLKWRTAMRSRRMSKEIQTFFQFGTLNQTEASQESEIN